MRHRQILIFKGDFALPSEYAKIVWTVVSEAARFSTGIRVGEMTSGVTPWPHQVKTYTRFLSKWPCLMLIAKPDRVKQFPPG